MVMNINSAADLARGQLAGGGIFFLLLLDFCGIPRDLSPGSDSLGKGKDLQSELSPVDAHQDGQGAQDMQRDAKCTSFIEEDKVESPSHLKLSDDYLQRRQNWTLCGGEGGGGPKQHQKKKKKKFTLLTMKHWNRFPRDTGELPLLEIFKAWLERSLSTLMVLQVGSALSSWLGRICPPVIPFSLCYAVIL